MIACLAALVTHARGMAQPRPDAAESIWMNARIYTMDQAFPRAEMIAVADGRVLTVGRNADIARWSGPETTIYDMKGATLLPGIIDAHGHVAGLGAFAMGVLDLSAATSFEDLVTGVAARARVEREGAWIRGGRWDQASWKFPDGRAAELPHHHMLSEAVPRHPVWLRRVDGHAALANAEAMRRAGITRNTPNPPGGEILRDATGEPTGVFIDNAMRLIERVIDTPTPRYRDLVLRAQEVCLSVGLTGVHDAGISPEEAEIYQQMAKDGELKMRVYGLLGARDAAWTADHIASHAPIVGEFFTFRAVKMYMDGAMGSRGAWLLEAYTDRPKDESGEAYTGLNVRPPADVRLVGEAAIRHGWQICTHAIGDRANREVLDQYAQVLRQRGTVEHPHRFRVEHAQLLHPDDIGRFAAMGVIASMQPRHCATDQRWVEARVGPARAKGAYAWASLLDAGAVLAFGSDFPVEPPSPWLGFHAAVTREEPAGGPAGGWQPQERLTREQTLHAFTLGAAYAGFEEDVKGSLVPGKYADFIVIDRDVMTCPEEDIPGTRVLWTVVGGKVVFSAQ